MADRIKVSGFEEERGLVPHSRDKESLRGVSFACRLTGSSKWRSGRQYCLKPLRMNQSLHLHEIMMVMIVAFQSIGRIVAGLLLVAVVSTIVVMTNAAVTHAEPMIEARVSRVLDGDTFTLRGESRRIRIWGLDAPEWDQLGGSFATETLRSLIVGEHLRCLVVDVDRYGRLVAQCILPSGRDLAAEMIRAGAAREYCRYSGGHYGTC